MRNKAEKVILIETAGYIPWLCALRQRAKIPLINLRERGWSHEFESIAVFFFDRGKGAELYESSGAVEFDPADAF